MVYQPALFYLQGFPRFTKASSKTRELQYIFTRWIRSLFVSTGLAKTPTSPKIHSLVLFHVSYRGTLNINPCIFTYLMMQLNIQHRMPSDLSRRRRVAYSLFIGHFTPALHSAYSCKLYYNAHSLISNCGSKNKGRNKG